MSVGVFRLPVDFYRSLVTLYPDDRFLAQPFASGDSQVSYPADIEAQMKQWCYKLLAQYVAVEKIFSAELMSSDHLDLTDSPVEKMSFQDGI